MPNSPLPYKASPPHALTSFPQVLQWVKASPPHAFTSFPQVLQWVKVSSPHALTSFRKVLQWVKASPPHALTSLPQVLQWVKSDQAVVLLQEFGIHLVGEGEREEEEATCTPAIVVRRLCRCWL